jgi:hypothetical protein
MDETIVQYDAKRVHTIGKKARLDYFSTTLDNSFICFAIFLLSLQQTFRIVESKHVK